MKIHIKNYRAISEAKIEVAPIALIAGANEAGKTSIALGIASGILGQGVVLSDVKADEAGFLVRVGASKAEIIIEGDKGATKMTIPGKAQTKGERPPRASRFALGLDDLFHLDPKSRAQVLLEYLKAEPSQEDLAAALPNAAGLVVGSEPVEENGKPKMRPVTLIEDLWRTILRDGWDNVHSSAKEIGAKLKGQWESAASTGSKDKSKVNRYGSQKAQSWIPDGWSSELSSASTQTLHSEVSRAKEILESMIATTAVSAEERERLENLGKNIPIIEANLATQSGKASGLALSVEREEKRQSYDKAIKAGDEAESLVGYAKIDIAESEKNDQRDRNKLAAMNIEEPVMLESGAAGNCPSCQAPILFKDGQFINPPSEEKKAQAKAQAKKRDERWRLERDIRTRAEDLQKARQRLAELEAAVASRDVARLELAALAKEAVAAESLATLKAQHEDAIRVAAMTESELDAARKAKERLETLGDKVADEQAVDRAREDVRRAEERLVAFTAKTEADRIAKAIALNQDVVGALAPTGVRQTKLATKLGEFNQRLGGLCAASGWKAVQIEDDLAITAGGFQHRFCSESAKFRARTTLQLAFAQLDESDFVVIDAADILDAAGRNGLFGLLAKVRLPAVVTMTEREERVPDLSKVKLGRSYWLSDGVAKVLGGGVEAVKAA